MSHGEEAEPTDLGLICESPMGRQDKATIYWHGWGGSGRRWRWKMKMRDVPSEFPNRDGSCC